MKNRILCCGNENILLYYATMNDKKLIYDMGQEEHKIFDCSWHEYQNEENEFYTGVKSRNNYLLIECCSRVIGSVSYAYNQAKMENMEIDIWFSSSNYTGRGLGTQTLILLTNFLNEEYKINTFLIRPSKKKS